MTEEMMNSTESTLSSTEGTEASTGTNTAGTTSEAPAAAPMGFLDGLSEELKGIPALKQFKDVEALAKSYVNAQGLLGKKLQDMSPEELTSVYGRMAKAPEEADGYDLTGVEHLTDDAKAFFKEAAFDMKLSPEQAKMFAAKFAALDHEQASMSAKALEESRKAAEEALQADWGKSLGDKVNLAKKAIAEFGGEELANQIESLGLGNNAQLIKAFAKVGESLLESNLVGETGLGQFSMTPEQARTSIQQKLQSSEFSAAYYDSNNPGHRQAVDELSRLYEITK